jgi:uncharacterized protein
VTASKKKLFTAEIAENAKNTWRIYSCSDLMRSSGVWLSDLGGEGFVPGPGGVYNWVVMIAKDLLDILVCPVCKKPLVLKENGESLKCGECHRVYPIRDNIPILLIDEAVTEPS